MPGRNTFTTLEEREIKELIEQKVKSSSKEQETTRRKIRKIGFCYSDYRSEKPGYTVADFEKLVNSGCITISDDKE